MISLAEISDISEIKDIYLQASHYQKKLDTRHYWPVQLINSFDFNSEIEKQHVWIYRTGNKINLVFFIKILNDEIWIERLAKNFASPPMKSSIDDILSFSFLGTKQKNVYLKTTQALFSVYASRNFEQVGNKEGFIIMRKTIN